jgi:Fur family ferric uptake transcriptional regulator
MLEYPDNIDRRPMLNHDKDRVDRVEGVRARVRAAGLRATEARIRVLAELSAAGDLLSHHDLEQALGQGRGRGGIDRVTLYRVLDSLVEAGLAHRVAGGDRVWRFGCTLDARSTAGPNASSGTLSEAHQRHAHFQCSDCGRIVCLREMPAVRHRRSLRVPRGYRPETVELTVKGRCPGCVS